MLILEDPQQNASTQLSHAYRRVPSGRLSFPNSRNAVTWGSVLEIPVVGVFVDPKTMQLLVFKDGPELLIPLGRDPKSMLKDEDTMLRCPALTRTRGRGGG
jgi:hypothetical protein